jgi:cell division protein FtsB
MIRSILTPRFPFLSASRTPKLRIIVSPPEKRGPFFWLAAILLAALVGNAVLGDGGLIELAKLSAERRQLGEDVFELMRGNDDLRRKIRVLRDSPRSLERLARRELGLVRPGEIVYRFPTVANEAPDGKPADRPRP